MTRIRVGIATTGIITVKSSKQSTTQSKLDCNWARNGSSVDDLPETSWLISAAQSRRNKPCDMKGVLHRSSAV